MTYKDVLIRALAKVSNRPEAEAVGLFNLMCKESPRFETAFAKEIDPHTAESLAKKLIDADTLRDWMMTYAYPDN